MPRSLAEEAISRVMQYLSASGIEPTRDVMAEALALVGEVIAGSDSPGTPDPAATLQAVMDALPGRFDLPDPQLPPASPELTRGSIRYAGGQ